MPGLHCQEGEIYRLLIRSRVKRLVLEIAVLNFLLGGCGPGPSETIHEKGEVVKARIEAVEPAPLTECAVLPGTVVSAERIEVSSRLTGYVCDLSVHEGQSVKKGQLLFAVDPTDVKAEIRQAKAGLAKAKAALADARDNYERYRNLYWQQAATKQQYEEYEKGYKVALGNYQVAEAELATARSQLKYAEVRAPFDGLVVSKRVYNGQLTAPGNPVLVLENPYHLQVRVQVDEQAFAHLRLGQELSVRFEVANLKMQSLTGLVERLVAAANPITHTHLVKVGLPAHSAAWSGAYALVSIPIGEQKAIIVPPAAIHTRAGLTGVFVVTEAGRAQFRMVTMGELVPRGKVVLSGLFSGDRVIVSAESPLANGMKIQVEPETGHE
jgi:membrane fusion protein, multidrug efflux system